jgi:FkbM family methyltransferase
MKEICFRGQSLLFKNFSDTTNLFLTNFAQVEPENFDFIDSLTSQDILLDLGACEGRYAIYAAKKGITTHAVEPNLQNFEGLKANSELNDLANLFLHKLAVGQYDHLSELVMPTQEVGGHVRLVKDSSSRNEFKDQPFRESIEVYSLDSFCAKNNINPTAIKMDVDGSEVDTLRGAPQTLKKISKIMIELYDNDPHFTECWKILGDSGFRLKAHFRITCPWDEPHLFNFWFKK